jgi:hypothetical protein
MQPGHLLWAGQASSLTVRAGRCPSAASVAGGFGRRSDPKWVGPGAWTGSVLLKWRRTPARQSASVVARSVVPAAPSWPSGQRMLTVTWQSRSARHGWAPMCSRFALSASANSRRRRLRPNQARSRSGMQPTPARKKMTCRRADHHQTWLTSGTSLVTWDFN